MRTTIDERRRRAGGVPKEHNALAGDDKAQGFPREKVTTEPDHRPDIGEIVEHAGARRQCAFYL